MAAEFTPYSAVLGGLLIGLASAMLLALNGRIAGISGIFDGAVFARRDASWRWTFLAGLLAGGAAYAALFGVTAESIAVARSPVVIVLAGLLVGFGTKLSNGCTSGHGVCGNARLSPRSMTATAVFMAVGALVVAIGGGA